MCTIEGLIKKPLCRPLFMAIGDTSNYFPPNSIVIKCANLLLIYFELYFFIAKLNKLLMKRYKNCKYYSYDSKTLVRIDYMLTPYIRPNKESGFIILKENSIIYMMMVSS